MCLKYQGELSCDVVVLMAFSEELMSCQRLIRSWTSSQSLLWLFWLSNSSQLKQNRDATPIPRLMERCAPPPCTSLLFGWSITALLCECLLDARWEFAACFDGLASRLGPTSQTGQNATELQTFIFSDMLIFSPLSPPSPSEGLIHALLLNPRIPKL